MPEIVQFWQSLLTLRRTDIVKSSPGDEHSCPLSVHLLQSRLYSATGKYKRHRCLLQGERSHENEIYLEEDSGRSRPERPGADRHSPDLAHAWFRSPASPARTARPARWPAPPGDPLVEGSRKARHSARPYRRVLHLARGQ